LYEKITHSTWKKRMTIEEENQFLKTLEDQYSASKERLELLKQELKNQFFETTEDEVLFFKNTYVQIAAEALLHEWIWLFEAHKPMGGEPYEVIYREENSRCLYHFF
jgi:hypothetical protein